MNAARSAPTFTHVLAAVRDLTRLELITEAMRAALEEIAAAAPQLLVGLVDEQGGRRYGRPGTWPPPQPRQAMPMRCPASTLV